MKILLYCWNAFAELILEKKLQQLGFHVIRVDKKCDDYLKDMGLAQTLIEKVNEEGIEAIISFNYLPIISMVCNVCQIPYYSWVHDSPHSTLYAKTIHLPCNHIGVFDREQVKRLEAYGVTTAYYAPLSVDVDYFEGIVQSYKGDCACDISFVGSLYTGDNDLYENLKKADCCEKNPESKKRWNELDALVERQCFCWDKDLIWQDKNHELLSWLGETAGKNGLCYDDNFFSTQEDVVRESLLDREVTVLERRQLLEKVADLSKNRYRFDLYTISEIDSQSPLVSFNRGNSPYHTMTPAVFARSRINLNISLRSIRSGIPLRVLDIMACGGFVLTNPQPEILEYFEEGREVAIFHDKNDCLEKINYYLAHENERAAIAQNGREKVAELFNYEKGLMRLLQVE